MVPFLVKNEYGKKNLSQISSQNLKLSSYKTLYSQVGRDAQLE